MMRTSLITLIVACIALLWAGISVATSVRRARRRQRRARTHASAVRARIVQQPVHFIDREAPVPQLMPIAAEPEAEAQVSAVAAEAQLDTTANNASGLVIVTSQAIATSEAIATSQAIAASHAGDFDEIFQATSVEESFVAAAAVDADLAVTTASAAEAQADEELTAGTVMASGESAETEAPPQTYKAMPAEAVPAEAAPVAAAEVCAAIPAALQAETQTELGPASAPPLAASKPRVAAPLRPRSARPVDRPDWAYFNKDMGDLTDPYSGPRRRPATSEQSARLTELLQRKECA